MKTIIFIILALSLSVFGQTKYFLPVPVESSDGRPIKNATVQLYQSGVKQYDLTWLDAGWYYWTNGSDSVVAGVYDVYVAGVLWRTNIGIIYDNNYVAAAQSVVAESLHVPDDVTIEEYNSGRNLRVKDLGISNEKLAGSITDDKLNQITTSDKVAGSAVELNADGALSDDSGLTTLVDDAAITKSSGVLTIKTGGVDSSHFGDGARAYMNALLSDSADTVMITNLPDGVSIGYKTATDTLEIKRVDDSVIVDIPADVVYGQKLSTPYKRQTSEYRRIIKRKRTRYPEAIAYYDLHAHTGFWEGVDVLDSTIIDSGEIANKDFFNGLFLINGQIAYEDYRPSANKSDRYENSGTQKKIRPITNGVVNNYYGFFDRTIADVDTNYMMDAPGDTVYFYDQTGNANDWYIWDVTDADDIEITIYNSLAANSFAIDTTQYDFIKNEYYVISFERRNDDTTTVTNYVQVQAGDQDYLLSVLAVDDSTWHKTEILYKHTGGLVKFNHALGNTGRTTHYRRLKVGRILNPDNCIFTKPYYVSHIRDALQNYPDVVIDTTNLTNASTSLFHITPFRGLQVNIETHMDYLTIDTVFVDSVNANTADIKLVFDNQSDTLYEVGDTAFVASIEPPEYVGYKVITVADSDTVVFRQNTYDFDLTDGSGFIWRPEWDYDIPFTFDTELTGRTQTVLIIYGSDCQFNGGLYDTPWSYNEYNQENRVLIWFDFMTDLDDVKYFYEHTKVSNRIFGIMCFADELTGPQKYKICQKISEDYKSIFMESWAPQLEWEPFRGYWLEKLSLFRIDNRKNNLNVFERSSSLVEWGDKAGRDSLVMFFNSGGEKGYNPGNQLSYEFSADNKIYMMVSDDRGETWGKPSLVYQGESGLITPGDTVSVGAGYSFISPDDSLVLALGQFDTLPSPTYKPDGQKVCFLKTGDLSNFRFIDANGSTYASAAWSGIKHIGSADTIGIPCYYPINGSNKHFILKSTDSCKTWIADTCVVDLNQSDVSEWTYVRSANWLGNGLIATRNDVGLYGYLYETSDNGNNWTQFTPYNWQYRGGDSAPVALAYLPDGRVIAAMNGLTRNRTYFAESWDRGRSWRSTGFLGDEEGVAFDFAGNAGNPTWPSMLPFSRSRFSYFNILVTAGDHNLDKYNDNTIFMVCDEGEDNKRCGRNFFRFMKK